MAALYASETRIEEPRYWTISVFTENMAGLLNNVTIVFTRRKLNIESITASESEVKGIYRYTMGLVSTKSQAEKVVKQLEKIIGVFRAFMHTEDETVYQEIALYKIPTDELTRGDHIEALIRKHYARILSVNDEFMVIEKTGHKEDTQALLEELQKYHVLEFVRSGRVAITKPMKEFITHLKELEEASDSALVI